MIPGGEATEPAPWPEDIDALLSAARSRISTSAQETLVHLQARLADGSLTSQQQALVGQLCTSALRALGRHEEALIYFADAAERARESGDTLLAAQLRVGEVDSLAMLGRDTEAAELAASLEQELRDAGAPVGAAKALGNLGSSHLRRDNYPAAVSCYDSALTLVSEADQPLLVAGLCVNRSIALTYLDRFDEARAGYAQAIALYDTHGQSLDATVALANIGFLHYSSGQYIAALNALQTAHAAFLAAGREHEAARCAIDLGDTRRALNLWPEATEAYSAALEVFDRLPLEYDRGRAELGAAAVGTRESRFADAEASLGQALAVFEAQENPVQLAQVGLCRAGLLLLRGEADAAHAAAAEAEARFIDRGLEGWAAESAVLQCEARLPIGAEGIARLEAIAATARRTLRGILESRAERLLGRLYQEAGDRERSLASLRRSASALESLRSQMAQEDVYIAFLGDKEGVYADLVAALLEGEPDDATTLEALEVVERSRSRMLLERIFSALPPEVGGGAAEDATWEQLAQARSALSRGYRNALESEGSDSRRYQPVDSVQLHALEADYARLLRHMDLSGQLPDSLLQEALPNIDALRGVLGDQTFILYCRAGDALAAFVLRRDMLKVFPHLASWEEVRRTTRRFRYHVQKMEVGPAWRSVGSNTLLSEMDAVLARLHALLLAPLEDTLLGTELIIAPTGPLHGLPFHALRGSDGYAMDRYEIVYTPSASVWYALTQRTALGSGNGSPLIVGYSEPGLAEVVTEVKTVASELPGATLLYGEAATLEAVRQNGPASSLWHVATHALFREDNPLFSGLQLADGWLMARDLYTISVQAELVTLSACATGKSRVEAGEELLGLTRGFLAAGARRVAASLWPVDDAATAELMGSFYAHLNGERVATALHAAQREIRQSRPHPYYWAPFLIIGCR